jgi:hypothetical protein
MAKLLNYAFYILAFFSIFFIGPGILLTRNHTLPIQSENDFQLSDWYEDASRACVSGLTIALLGLLAVARTVHGKELAVSPMDCQINTQSTPDAVDLSKAVTLVGRTVVQSLRHSIYDHEDCAKLISGWVRSRLVPFP